MSAGSSVRSTVHHRLVGLVVEELERQGYLKDETQIPMGEDGEFFMLNGQLQISDPTAFRSLFEDFRSIESMAETLQAGPNPLPKQATRADKRAGRAGIKSSFSKPFLDAMTLAVEKFAESTVRIRVMRAGKTLGVCVAEREKFVEDLGRLTTRHGYVMSGSWEVLGQLNISTPTEAYTPDNPSAILDVVESAGISVLTTFNEISGAAGSPDITSLTPLAIYRRISPRA